MNKYFKQIMVACLLLASCHSIEPAWQDWFTPTGMNNGWTNLKVWVATQWASLWAAFAGIKKTTPNVPVTPPSSEAPLVNPPPLAAPPAPEKVNIIRSGSQENLLQQSFEQSLDAFIERLRLFSSDLSNARRKSLTYEDLVKNHAELIDNLDEISQLDLPKSITAKLTAPNPDLVRELTSALIPLQSDLPWHYLKDVQTLEQNPLPAHLLPDLIRFINRYAEQVPESEAKQLKNYNRILEAHRIQQKPVTVSRYQDLTMDKLLALLRSYKIQQVYQQLYNNSGILLKKINDFYRQFFPQQTIPDLTFLAYFA